MKLTQDQARELVKVFKDEQELRVAVLLDAAGMKKNRYSNWMSGRISLREDEISTMLKRLNLDKQKIEEYFNNKKKTEEPKIKEEIIKEPEDIKEFQPEGINKVPNNFDNPFKEEQKEEEVMQELLNSETANQIFEMVRGYTVPKEIRKDVFEIKGRMFIDSVDNVNEHGVVLFNGEMVRAYTGIRNIKDAELILQPVAEHVINSWVDVSPIFIYDEQRKEYCVYMYCRGIENIRICKNDVVAYAIKIK